MGYERVLESELRVSQNTIDDYRTKGFETITFDTTGSEFATLSQVTGIKIFFAHSYSFWERGFNENAKGLFREYFPKERSLKAVTADQIQAVQSVIN